MADLTRTHRWLRYVPDLGDNRELAAPFYVEVASGLTKVQLSDYHAALRAWGETKHELEAFAAATTELLTPYVRMGREPLSVQGRRVLDLGAYIALGMEVMGESPVLELLRVVREYNELGGPKVLFSAPPSGGTSSTPAPSTGRAGEPMAPR